MYHVTEGNLHDNIDEGRPYKGRIYHPEWFRCQPDVAKLEDEHVVKAASLEDTMCQIKEPYGCNQRLRCEPGIWKGDIIVMYLAG